MKLPRVTEGLRRASDFLDDHGIVKWFVVPIWLMASVLLLLFVGVSTATHVESAQVVGLFVGFSLGIVFLGLLAERVVVAVASRRSR